MEIEVIFIKREINSEWNVNFLWNAPTSLEDTAISSITFIEIALYNFETTTLNVFLYRQNSQTLCLEYFFLFK